MKQVKRNADRFPPDFVFQLSSTDLNTLRSQFVTSKTQDPDVQYDGALRSQFVTLKRGGRRTAPYAFTEHGALMAANVLNSPEAAKMSVYVVRAFIKQRHLILSQADILKRLAQIDKKPLQHDDVLRVTWQELQPLFKPAPDPPRPEIGFHVQESAPRYRTRPRKRQSALHPS